MSKLSEMKERYSKACAESGVLYRNNDICWTNGEGYDGTSYTVHPALTGEKRANALAILKEFVDSDRALCSLEAHLTNVRLWRRDALKRVAYYQMRIARLRELGRTLDEMCAQHSLVEVARLVEQYTAERDAIVGEV
jgi:hypothetical protein